MTTQEKQSVFEDVTARIVEELERGTVPWHQPWAFGLTGHRNGASDRPYRGINPFILEAEALKQGYEDRRWVTFKQAQRAGGRIRKGEHGVRIVFWKPIMVDDRDNPGKKKAIPMLRTFVVFNVAQTEGIDWPEVLEREPVEPIAAMDELIAGYAGAPSIRHGGGRAAYAPDADVLFMPDSADFESPEAYYQTLAHELIHSTGHGSRLDRKLDTTFGSSQYGLEELVAEIGAAMLLGVAGVEPQYQQSAAYVKNWLQALQDDPKMIVVAAARAQKAVDYILGVTFEEETNNLAAAPAAA